MEPQVLEHGDLHVLYRPAVDEDDPSGPVDVADLHLVLVPSDGSTLRLLTIGRKRLPDPSDRQDRFWGYVAAVTEDRQAMAGILGPSEYDTETRGRRRRPGCRPVAVGAYDLRRRGRDTRLVVVFDRPDDRAEVQRDLNVPSEATYVVSVKNPEAGSPPDAGLGDERRAELPDELQDRFGDRRWTAVDPPGFLDHEGVEVLFIGADPEAEGSWEEDQELPDPYEQLRLDRGQHPEEPLLEGAWA